MYDPRSPTTRELECSRAHNRAAWHERMATRQIATRKLLMEAMAAAHLLEARAERHDQAAAGLRRRATEGMAQLGTAHAAAASLSKDQGVDAVTALRAWQTHTTSCAKAAALPPAGPPPRTAHVHPPVPTSWLSRGPPHLWEQLSPPSAPSPSRLPTAVVVRGGVKTTTMVREASVVAHRPVVPRVSADGAVRACPPQALPPRTAPSVPRRRKGARRAHNVLSGLDHLATMERGFRQALAQ
jgi:hypothetical protein